MKKFMLAAIALFLPLVYGWTINSLPDPQADPQGCGRDVKGWVCSPDGLVATDELSVIQGNIMTIYDGAYPYSKMICPRSDEDVPVELMAIIVNKVDGKGDPAMRVARFATGIHDRFGVGSKDCGSGAVIVMSVQDKQIYISTGDLVGTMLKQPQIDGIITGVRDDLRHGNYGKAMEAVVIQVGLTLSGKVDPSAGGDGKSSFDWGLAFFGSAIAGFFGLSAWTGHRRRSEQQNVRGRLRGMQRDLKAAKQGTYTSTSCPICLEDFTSRDRSTAPAEAASNEGDAGQEATGMSESSPLLGSQEAAPVPSAPPLPDLPASSSAAHASDNPQASTAQLDRATESFTAPKSDYREPFMLPCGHTFCEPCISLWVKRHSDCPVCRQPVSGAASTPRPPPPQRPTDDPAAPRLQLRPARGGRGCGRTAFGWHDGDFDLYGPELAFRLMRLRRYHPDYVTQAMVDDMLNEAHGTGAGVPDWGHHPVFVSQISAQTRSEMQARGSQQSGASFGGGHSSGGGGGGW